MNSFFNQINKLIQQKIYSQNLFYKAIFSNKAKMRKTKIIGFTVNQKLIVKFEDNQTLVQTKFQGFQITNDIKLRPLFDDFLNTEIQSSFNKNDKTIRYQNYPFFTKHLRNGSLTINSKELEDSKLYNPEQKKNFTQISQLKESDILSKIGTDLNQKQNLKIIKNLIKQNKLIRAKVQGLSDHVLLRLELEDKIYFLKCKIENCKQYFQLFSQLTFWKDSFLPVQTQIKIVSVKYNIFQKSSNVFITFQQSILQKLLSQGWIALNQKDYYKISKQEFKKLSTIQNHSISTHKGIHSSKSEILSFIYAKNNYVGIVTNVIEGYIYEITSSKTQQVGQVQLPMVICPFGDDVGSFQCRQFARKQLIGKQVNVYLHKQGGLNTTGNIIRIQDWKDIESVLLQNGYATVREEFSNSIMGQKYNILQAKAKQKKKGIHRKDVGNKRFQDLTQPPINKAHLATYLQRRHQILSKLGQNQEIVIEQIINSMRFKVRFESFRILLNFRLQGVTLPSLNPNLKEYIQLKQESDKFMKRHIHQRTMTASVSDFDKQTNEFIGTLIIGNLKVDLQQLLIKNSFVCTDKINFNSKYNDLQIEAKKSKKLIWQPQLICFSPGFSLDKQQYCFEGRFSWIHNGKITYVQPKDNFETIEKIQANIRKSKLINLHKDKHKIGAWCAAPYEGEFYRAVIKSKKDNKVTLQFFDWGNHEVVSAEVLKQLPQEYLYIERQCIKVSLNLLRATKNQQALQRVLEILFDRGVYVFKKINGDSVDIFGSELHSVNEELIRTGVLKADKQELKIYDNKQLIKVVQQQLRKQRVGIWQQSSSSQQQTEQY